MTVDNRLRVWRAENDFTLDDVAGLTGYSEAMISLIERGKRNPSPRAKVRIARRLGVHVSDLFEPEPILVEEEATG